MGAESAGDDPFAGLTRPEEIDLAYARAAPRPHRRRFGQFFTPPACADMMADWIAAARPRRVLDPALGTGVLARAVAARLPGARVTGCEIDPRIAHAARRAIALAGGGAAIEIRAQDFFDLPPDESFDAIIANPPYLRPQDLPDAARHIARVAKASGLGLSGSTNAYGLFLLDCCRRLAPGGRLAFLIPAEWSNSNFGGPIRDHLLDRGLLRGIVHTCPSAPGFEDALTTMGILLVEKAPPAGVALRTAFVPKGGAIPGLASLFGPLAHDGGALIRETPVQALRAAPKWGDLIERGAPRIPEGFVPLGRLARTRRGIATGANGFFHLPLARARALGIAEDRLVPCIAKVKDAPGADFGPEDLAALVARDRPTHLIHLTGDLSGPERAYVAMGEAEGLHRRFLTRARSPWYANEKIHIAPIWAAVFGRQSMRFVLNSAGIAHLTAFHGIFPLSPDRTTTLALLAALNSGLVQDLMKSQIRAYGGGLNKLEPRDLLAIMLPDLAHCRAATRALLAETVAGRRARPCEAAEARALDRLVLQAGREASGLEAGHP
ncbi:N-6 DNA methylase [Pseudogemmobacter sonorensis]|uniref:N-6 DNA methylase n=1 Tax=Pseudogemmobacter sonorensis TaxID=2989681 RepID=UPI0036C577B4